MKVRSLKIIVSVLIIVSMTIALAKPLFAQVIPNAESQVRDQQLRSFAKVYVQVERIRQTYEPRAKEAVSPDEGKQIQQEAQSKFQEALSKEGLSEENYVHIFEVARADQDVRKKLLQMIVEERGKS